MAAKVYSLNAYKQKRLRGSLNKLEYVTLCSSILLSYLTIGGFLSLLAHMSIQSNKPSLALYGVTISLMFAGVLLYHGMKTIRIFRSKRLHKEMSYLSKYEVAIAIQTLVFNLALFSLHIATPMKLAIALFTLPLMIWSFRCYLKLHDKE